VEHDIDFSAALGCLWLDSASAVLQAASLASRLYPDVHTGFHRRAALVAFPVGLAMSILHMDSYGVKKPVNQCDGCRRHLPIKNGIHYGDEGYVAVMYCTKDRYQQPSPNATQTHEGKSNG
jgi:hypothetical protein